MIYASASYDLQGLKVLKMSKKNMSYYRKPIRRRSNSALVGPTVIFADFLLLNLLFFCLIALKGQFVPDFFLTYTKMTVLVMNFSMLIAQFFFRTIVQQRLIRRSHILTNTFRLVVTQVVLMFISIYCCPIKLGKSYFPSVTCCK